MRGTGAEVRVVFIIARDLVAGCEALLGACVFDELIFAAAGCEVVRGGFGGVQRAVGEVSAEEYVEAAVDGLEGVVADEDKGVEALEDHADLIYAVPAVMATCLAGSLPGLRIEIVKSGTFWEVRRIKAVSATSCHGFQQRLTTRTV